ncbi:TPR repeat-containing protein [Paenibacillus curdlanolyticus YK9]|uniref:TPR repeat-containing protein n=1 Tax=Paenibacillus curdlanolyticus YK9 TaxID=717606 RepID=E0IF94_9BACL|nr:tetratricopeptide repeat protein [Paenibacillus curdlanolyticus]EFM08870.1 TPR repeat-containing protein [Paenibacillus curdlanolyticus YK9]
MIGKFLLFGLLLSIFGNPILAIIAFVVILYIIDRRFVGLSPSLVKPIRRIGRIRKLRQLLDMNPNDLSAKLELAKLLIDKRSYRQARELLEPLQERESVEQSAEYWDDLGTSLLHTGEPEAGEAAIRKALSINPRVKYGQPYLRLAAKIGKQDAGKALDDLEAFQQIQTSSCEGYYRLAKLNQLLGRKAEAKQALNDSLRLYRQLPRYKKRQERRWALLSLFARWTQ